MRALVIDTSSAAVSAGIADITDVVDGVGTTAVAKVLAERVTINSRAHAELLTPAIRRCLAESKTQLDELGAVIAGVGPGPFTGLRVGLMTAAAFADALGIPTYPVCSLDAIASLHAGHSQLLVATDARRKEVYWAVYEDGVRKAGPQVSKPAAVHDQAPLGGTVAVVGAGARLYRETLVPDGIDFVDDDYPTLLGLARCAAARVTAAAPGEDLVPLYLRRPDATEPAAARSVQPLVTP